VTTERLQKILANAGVASRRHAEEYILAGRVRVNGKIVKELGSKANPKKDRIEVDGNTISAEQPMTILMNKPRGVVCTANDPEGRETVVDLVRKIKTRLYPVGRLDYATSGALLLTNDGDLSYALTHPKHGVEKTYLLKIRGQVKNQDLDKWRKGVDIGDVVTRPAEVFKTEEKENFTWIQVTIHEGRNRQIRRMGEATGLDVNKLKRTSFAGLTIEGLRVGDFRELTPKETTRLKRDYINPVKRSKRESEEEGPQNSPQSSAPRNNRRKPKQKRPRPPR
jgi:23S rRNA pseudouridine2605 synthase